MAPTFPKRPFLKRRAQSDIPPRLAAPDSQIDGIKLRENLTAIAESGLQVRGQVLALLKSELDQALGQAKELFTQARIDGLECARLIAAIHVEIVTALYDFTTIHVVRASNPTRAETMALCAVGGFGRGEMAPHSDLDLLFLMADKKGSAFTENVTEYILYMLWDLGLKVGHATRTIDQSIKLAKEDQTILTSLLDLQYLCGEEDLATALFSKFAKDITRGKGRAYISAKLEERDIRHARGDGKIIDPQRAQDYVDMGLFDERAATRFVRAADFLWRARIHLHWTSARPTENLSFDKQTLLARHMGHASGPVEEAVEKFMREYFTNAREVGALTRIACAKLEADNAIRLPRGIDNILPSSRRNLKEAGLFLDHGRLSFEDPMQLRDDPALIMRLFSVAGQRNVDIHPDALNAIDFRRNLIDNDFRRNPEIAKIFDDILLKSKAPYGTLKLMNEAGVLGRYILEFGGIVARTQFNMHHAYTVDEHTLRLVNYFHDIESGELADENPVATELVKGFSVSERRCLYLTCLLHDTGKGVGDQCIEGARLSRRACRRLGLTQDEIETVAWLVRSHLDMSETAQRRDISDPETIADFSGRVGSFERLKMLYLLTIVDIRAVGPGIWNDWKGVLLRDLFRAASNYLDGKAELEPSAKASAIKAQFAERLPGGMAARIASITDELGDAYWLGFDMADLVRHARFYAGALDIEDNIAVQTRVDKPRDITELWVLAQDRAGLFSDLTLAISACGASITGARLYTGENGRVMNVYYLQNNEGLAFGRVSEHLLDSLRARAHRAAVGNIDGLSDRPGLLYALAASLYEAELDVLSAHVENVGEKAIDAFYVQRKDGRGVSAGQRKKMRSILLDILGHSQAPPRKTAVA